MGLFRNNSGNDTSDELELIANISGNYYDPLAITKKITSNTITVQGTGDFVSSLKNAKFTDGTLFDANGLCLVAGTYYVEWTQGGSGTTGQPSIWQMTIDGMSFEAIGWSGVMNTSNSHCKFIDFKTGETLADKITKAYSQTSGYNASYTFHARLLKRDRYVNPAVPELGTIYEFTWSSRLGNNNSTWVYSNTGVTVPTGLYMFFLTTGGDGNTSNDYHNYLYRLGVFNGTTNCSTMLNGAGWWTAGYGSTHRTGLLRVDTDGGNRLGIINTGNQGTNSKCQLMRIV